MPSNLLVLSTQLYDDDLVRCIGTSKKTISASVTVIFKVLWMWYLVLNSLALLLSIWTGIVTS
jgi:hypothetical protein